MFNLESIAYLVAFMGFFSGLVVGWNVRDRKCQDDEAYRLASIEQQMKLDGWVK